MCCGDEYDRTKMRKASKLSLSLARLLAIEQTKSDGAREEANAVGGISFENRNAFPLFFSSFNTYFS